MTARNEWERWSEDWRNETSSQSPDRVRQVVESEQRRLRRSQRIESSIVIAGILGVGAALIHTHDPIDLVTAAVTLVGLIVLRLISRRSMSEPDPSLSGTTSDFVAASTKRLRLQLQTINVIWIAIALNLVFFLPWWISGFRMHRAELDAPIMLASWWFPLVALTAMACWSLVFRRRLSAELERLRELESAYRDH